MFKLLKHKIILIRFLEPFLRLLEIVSIWPCPHNGLLYDCYAVKRPLRHWQGEEDRGPHHRRQRAEHGQDGAAGGGEGGGERQALLPTHQQVAGDLGWKKRKLWICQKKSVKACSLQTLLKSFFSHTSDLLNVRTIAPATRSTRSFTRSEKWPIIFKKRHPIIKLIIAGIPPINPPPPHRARPLPKCCPQDSCTPLGNPAPASNRAREA